jgi:hypothetical protein
MSSLATASGFRPRAHNHPSKRKPGACRGPDSTPTKRLNVDRFAIINSRKRAIIALVHSVFFLGVAAVQLAISHAMPLNIRGEKATAGMILLAIYLIVTAVLLILLRFSACAREKLYFALCAASAAFGLVRIVLGDAVLHANVLRVLLLFGAVVIGSGILRSHSTLAGATEVQLS